MCLTKYIQKTQFGLGFEIENKIEDQFQSNPKFIWILLTVLRCIFGPNLENLTLIGGEFWCGHLQMG